MNPHTIIKSPVNISRQIADRFKAEIAAGRYQPLQPLPSYGYLAESYGISKSTVHAAFRLLADEGLLYLKQGKGAFVNGAGLAPSRPPDLREVGFIAFNTFSASDNYMTPFLDSLNRLAREKKFNLHVHFIRGMSVLAPENRLLQGILEENRYQGVILASPLDVRDIAWLKQSRIPFVAATSRYQLEMPAVSFDHRRAVALAAGCFRRGGARRVAVFTGPLSWERDGIIPYAREITQGFADLEREGAFAVDSIPCDYDYQSARANALRYFRANAPADGCFFSADVIAYGVLSVLKERNADLAALTLVNYCEQDEHVVPWSIKKPLPAMGRRAFQMLECIVKNRPLAETRVILKPQLVKP